MIAMEQAVPYEDDKASRYERQINQGRYSHAIWRPRGSRMLRHASGFARTAAP